MKSLCLRYIHIVYVFKSFWRVFVWILCASSGVGWFESKWKSALRENRHPKERLILQCPNFNSTWWQAVFLLWLYTNIRGSSIIVIFWNFQYLLGAAWFGGLNPPPIKRVVVPLMELPSRINIWYQEQVWLSQSSLMFFSSKDWFSN